VAVLPQRRWRWPLFTPLKVNFMLNWLEKKDPSFNVRFPRITRALPA
jgi:hypothetical protein